MYVRLKLYIAQSIFSFFFQAEDGIRDKLVTGVQTCALPILSGKFGVTAVTGHGDIAEPETSKALMQVAFKEFKRLDALVVNAGTHAAGMLGKIGRASCRERV